MNDYGLVILRHKTLRYMTLFFAVKQATRQLWYKFRKVRVRQATRATPGFVGSRRNREPVWDTPWTLPLERSEGGHEHAEVIESLSPTGSRD